MKIEIFSSGCTICCETEKRVLEALNYLRLTANICKIENPSEISLRGVLLTPAIAINGEIKCAGRSPEIRELLNWLTTAIIKEENQ